MFFGSVCSGIEAASVAWRDLGWRAAWFSEIEPFPCALLAHHYSYVPNLGDMTALPRRVLEGEIAAPDVLVGGTPCQAFSVAGMREGLNDPRGQLTIKFVELADAIDHVRRARGAESSIIVWENVPGVLSDKGNAFGCFLGALSGESCELKPPGERWPNAGCVFGPTRTIAWRVLDAQYFGVAQRRRRVFVVASARNDIHPAQILFEFDGVRRDSAPSREEGESATGNSESRSRNSIWPAPVASTLDAHFGDKQGLEDQHVNAGCPLFVPVYSILLQGDATQKTSKELAGTLRRDAGGEGACVQAGMQVRRLTPVECERLQGFPDDYTLIPVRGKPAADGPRYKALGNSMAVPVMQWIGRRIALFAKGGA